MRSLAAIAMLAALGCDLEGAPNPAPRPDEGTSAGAGGGFEPHPAEPSIRTIETRSPLGGVVGNLLVDGDFETSVTFEGSSQQLGWFIFGSSQGYLRMKTGGICRSGLRCGLLPSGHVAFGRGTSAAEGKMVASIWAKPPEGSDCNTVQPVTLGCDFSGGFTQPLSPVSVETDDEGWCFYEGRLAATSEPTCFYVEAAFAGLGTAAILDDARLLPADGTAPISKRMIMSPAREKRARDIVRQLRDRTPIGNPPRFQPPSGG